MSNWLQVQYSFFSPRGFLVFNWNIQRDNRRMTVASRYESEDMKIQQWFGLRKRSKTAISQ